MPLPLVLLGWVLATALLATACAFSRADLVDRQGPVVGVVAAAVFAAQTITFPLVGGTSGHLLGAALAVAVLGPWSAVLVMGAVVTMQALLFQDGGLLAMGWNLVNMGGICVLTAACVWDIGCHLTRSDGARLVVAGLAAWVAVVCGAAATAFEVAAAGVSPLSLALPVMAGTHAFVGLGEALITAGAVGVLQRSRPQVLSDAASVPGRRAVTWALLAAATGLGLAFLVRGGGS